VSVIIASNVHSFAVGGAILLRRPWRQVLNGDTKDKILFKSLIELRLITEGLRCLPLPQNCMLSAVILSRYSLLF
jgi:hypothetical protein